MARRAAADAAEPEDKVPKKRKKMNTSAGMENQKASKRCPEPELSKDEASNEAMDEDGEQDKEEAKCAAGAKEKSFARRPPPKTEQKYMTWNAIRVAFNDKVALYLDYPGKYQEPCLESDQVLAGHVA